jgi:ABC-type amino acid transport system permease subunit
VSYQWNWDVIWQYRQLLIDGLLATLQLVLAALPLSVCLGLLIAAGRSFLVGAGPRWGSFARPMSSSSATFRRSSSSFSGASRLD